jgi:hypothetical protein
MRFFLNLALRLVAHTIFQPNPQRDNSRIGLWQVS